MMISRTGKSGLTLLEALLAVAVIGFGLAGIIRGYALTLGALRTSQENIRATFLLKEKMTDLERLALDEGGITPGILTGEFEGDDADFAWNAETSPSGPCGLSTVTLTVERAGRERKHSLVTYLPGRN